MSVIKKKFLFLILMLLYVFYNENFTNFTNLKSLDITFSLNVSNYNVINTSPISVIFNDFLPKDIYENIVQEYNLLKNGTNGGVIHSNKLVEHNSILTKLFHSKHLQQTISGWIQVKLKIMEQFKSTNVFDSHNNLIRSSFCKNSFGNKKSLVGVYIISENSFIIFESSDISQKIQEMLSNKVFYQIILITNTQQTFYDKLKYLIL